MGELLDVEIEIISKPRHEYQTAAYAEIGLPKAPAIMLGKEVIVAGADIDEADLIDKIRQYQQNA